MIKVSPNFRADLSDLETNTIDHAISHTRMAKPLVNFDALEALLSQWRDKTAVPEVYNHVSIMSNLHEAVKATSAVKSAIYWIDKYNTSTGPADNKDALAALITFKRNCTDPEFYEGAYSPDPSKIMSLTQFHKKHRDELNSIITTIAKEIPHSDPLRAAALELVAQDGRRK